MSDAKNKLPEGQVLRKTINVLEATLLVIGVVIGSGVFFKPATVLATLKAPGLSILVWVAGALITLCGALTMSEIGAAIPKTGGLYVYLKELFGRKWAFLFGWVQVLVYLPGLAAALAVILATQATSFVPMDAGQQRMFAIGTLLFLMVLNIASTVFSTKFSAVFTVAKLMPIAAIIFAGLSMGTAHTFSPMIPAPQANVNIAAACGAALLGVLFAFEGWVPVANLSGELKNPEKDFPKALFFGVMAITVAYLGVNLAVFNTLPFEQIVASKKVASDTATVLFGPVGEKFIAAGILISISGCLSGFMLTSARIPYAMALDNLIPGKKFFSYVNERTNTPINAIFLQTALAILYTAFSFDSLTDMVVFVIWLFIILGMWGVFVLRNKRADLIKPGQYKVPMYPIIPIIGIVGALYVVVNTLASGAMNAIFGVLVTLIGVPVYHWIESSNRKSGSAASQ